MLIYLIELILDKLKDKIIQYHIYKKFWFKDWYFKEKFIKQKMSIIVKRLKSIVDKLKIFFLKN